MKKKTGYIMMIAAIIFMLSGITYAWWTWSNSSSDNTNVVVTVGGATITYDSGADITNNNLIPVSSKEKGISKDVTMSSTQSVYLDLYLDVTTLPDSLKDASFKYELVNGSSSVTTGNFSANKAGDSIALLKSNEVNATSQSYTLYIWIDGNMSNPSSMYKQDFSFTLRASATDEEPNPAKDTLIKLGLTANDGEPKFGQVATTDEGIYSTKDNNGTSYYFRGAVTNNYVKFAGFYWRIIRINGDGSIRMIYDGTSAHSNWEASKDRQIGTTSFNSGNDNTYFGYMYGQAGASTYEETHTNTNNSNVKTIIDTWYKSNIEDKGYSNKLADTIYCNDRSLESGTGIGTTVSYYKAYNRNQTNKKPSLICPQQNDMFTVKEINKGNGALTYPVGLITADEIAYAGGHTISNNKSFYLYTGQYYWTMSPYSLNSDVVMNWVMSLNGNLDNVGLVTSCGVRPVVSLKSNVTFTGDGTQNNPFTPAN